MDQTYIYSRMSLLFVITAIQLLHVTHRCSGFSLISIPAPPQQPPDVAAIVRHAKTNDVALRHTLASGPWIDTSPSFFLSALDPPVVQTQSQQMNDAMVIKTMKGTQWRVIEDRVSSSKFFGSQSPRFCKSLVTFGGFSGVDNKGTVGVEYFCGNGNSDAEIAEAPKKIAKGRWVTKPSRLARGSVQLSARWKVRCPEEGGKSVIYKGFIDADKIIGRNGKSVNAEMVGVILTGEEVNQEKVIGKFTADFVRQLSEEEEREIANNTAGGNTPTIESIAPIVLSSPQ
jgi:hypothetical protein